MNKFEKGHAIKNGLRKGFQNGTSKISKRKCYGYCTTSDCRLTIDPIQAEVVRLTFRKYLDGDSLGKIAISLKQQQIPSPTGKAKWNQAAIDKLLSNEKYIGGCYSRKPSAPTQSELKTKASRSSISTPLPMRPLFLTKCLRQYSKKSSDVPRNLKVQLPYVSHFD